MSPRSSQAASRASLIAAMVSGPNAPGCTNESIGMVPYLSRRGPPVRRALRAIPNSGRVRLHYGRPGIEARVVNFPLRPKPDARFGVETSRVVGGPRVPGSPASPPITPPWPEPGSESRLGLSFGITGNDQRASVAERLVVLRLKANGVRYGRAAFIVRE